MNKTFRNITKYEIKRPHLVYVLFFLVAFTIRIFASQKLPINSYEASILLRITDETSTYPEGLSIIEFILIKTSFFIFGDNDLAARIWPILAGSILSLLPLYLKDQLENKTGMILSLFIVVDPFMIVNSIQIGSNIFAFLALVFLLAAIWKKDFFTGTVFLVLLIISGRGTMLAMIFGIAFLVYQKTHQELFIENLIEETRKWGKKNNVFQFQKYLIIGLFLALIITIYKFDISLILSDVISNLEKFSSHYSIGESPLAFLVVMFSYLPFYLFIFIYQLINTHNQGKWTNCLLIIWITITLLFIIINPYHKFYDLLWVSGFLLIYISLNTPVIIQGINNNDLIKITYFLVLLIALIMNFARYIYQGYSGLSQFQTSITTITIIIVVAGSVIILTYQLSLKYSLLRLTNAALILLLFVQAGFSFRASGLANSRYSEVLWSGSIFDKHIIQDQIKNAKITKDFANDGIKIGLVNVQEPSFLWELRSYDVNSFNENLRPNEKFDILISKTEAIGEPTGKYFGQEFVVDSFPRWYIEPINSLFSYDFWSWLIFRKSIMRKSINYIWVNGE